MRTEKSKIEALRLMVKRHEERIKVLEDILKVAEKVEGDEQ